MFSELRLVLNKFIHGHPRVPTSHTMLQTGETSEKNLFNTGISLISVPRTGETTEQKMRVEIGWHNLLNSIIKLVFHLYYLKVYFILRL